MAVNVGPTPAFMKKFKNVKHDAAKFGKKAKKSSKKASKLVNAMKGMAKGKGMMSMMNDNDEDDSY